MSVFQNLVFKLDFYLFLFYYCHVSVKKKFIYGLNPFIS